MEQKFYIELTYPDGSEFGFNVLVEGSMHVKEATLMMITRGTLMASNALRAVCYNEAGFDVCSYQK